ncbi:MAG TPA: M48 family metalloprotease, partial [Candidatus Sulfotelmatobacter sp.]
MFALGTFSWLGRALLGMCAAGLVAGQTSTPDVSSPNSVQPLAPLPGPKPVAVNVLVDSALRQERRLLDLMRNFKPIVETYIQEEKPDADLGIVPKGDDYFLSRLDLTGDALATSPFEESDSWKERWEQKLLKKRQPFAASGFAQALFPDLGHFDRQNYTFDFVRWEVLGEVRCGVVDVKPRENAENRGFVGRIWIEDQDFNIVRFTGAYTSKKLTQRAFHFDSWRLNTLGIMWMPAYIYTQESMSEDSASHDLWFKAQTRIWGYDLQNAGDHREFAKPLTDVPVWVDPKSNEASQGLSPSNSLGQTTYTPEDNVVERLQVAGLMAPDGEVDQILQTVANNLLVTNDLDIAGVRCRVLLTTPLESFVVGRTIVVSRGLLDVLPDEATLAAVLAHELGHIVLQHPVSVGFLSGLTVPFSDLKIFSRLNFNFDAAEETAADEKGLELLSKSPYKAQLANAGLFLEALEARSTQLPNLLHGRFSNDFGSSHLLRMQALANLPKRLQMNRLDQTAALPLGSRIAVDPWSDRIAMIKRPPVRPLSASEKMPLEVSPFFPYLKRLDGHEKVQAQT